MDWFSSFFGSTTRDSGRDVSKRPSREERSPRNNKRRRIETAQNDCEEVETFISDDILHLVFGFFVSNAGVVDANSLESAMLVSKRWCAAATSRSLWAIPAGIVGRPVHEVEPIGNSIRITEIHKSSDNDGEVEQVRGSLLGFKKLCSLCIDGPSVFRAMERATGKSCILSITDNEEKSAEVLRELYSAHATLKGDFLKLGSKSGSQFPRGIYILDRFGGSLARWYDCTDPQAYMQRNIEATKWQRISPNLPSDAPALQVFVDHARAIEQTLPPQTESQPRLPLECWAIIVDWIAEIVQCFELDDEVAFLTMSLFDRFLASNEKHAKRDQLQMVASACLSIASKCSGNSLTLNDLTFCADNCFTVAQVRAAEDLALHKLEWKLAFPTTLQFVKAYSLALGHDRGSKESMMCRYVAELSLQSTIHLERKPSMIAAGVVALANYCVQNHDPLWTETLQQMTGYSVGEVCECAIDISRMYHQVRSSLPDLAMIARRYRQSALGGVSTVAVPFIHSAAPLLAYHERSL